VTAVVAESVRLDLRVRFGSQVRYQCRGGETCRRYLSMADGYARCSNCGLHYIQGLDGLFTVVRR
jgi:hypothetical protein